MNPFKQNALALGVAQVAWLASQAAMAQTTAPTPPGTEAAKLGTVVVSGQRAALESAQKIKQNADEVVDSIVAEDIGKLPDRSVTEVLQRIVGVTIDRSMPGDPTRFAVEGSGAAVRGLSYVRSSLNGRDSISANGGRSLSFEDVPPELMAGVDVYKNPSSEQVEGGISGLVNLRTAMPLDYKGFKAAVSLQTTYATLKQGKSSPSASLLLSNRWKTGLGDIGILLDLAYSESATRTDTMNVASYYPRSDLQPGKTLWVPKGVAWRSAEFERTRRGSYLALQWRPHAGLTTSLSYFKSRYSNDWSDAYLSFQHSTPYDLKVANGTYGESGNLLTGTLSDPAHGGIDFSGERRVATLQNSTGDLSWNLQWKPAPDWQVTADVQRISSRANRFDSSVATGIQMPKQQIDLSGDLPRVVFDEADVAYLADRNKYYWASTMEHLDRSKASSTAARLDLAHDFDHAVLRDLRVGLRWTDRDSTNQNTNPSYNWQAITPPWMLYKLSGLAYLGDPRFNNQTTLNTFPNFFNGKVSVPAVVLPDDSLARGYPDSYATLHSYRDTLCNEQKAKPGNGWITCPAWQPATYGNDPASINQQAEKTQALYAQLRFGFDDWAYPVDGNIGLRYVRTENVASGYTVFTPSLNIPVGNTLAGLPVPSIPAFKAESQFDNAYSHVLPSLNLRVKLRGDLQLRLALGKAISRPDFGQLQGFTSLSQGATLVTDNATKVTTVTRNIFTGTAAGNPLLRPTRASQLDLTAEWYFARSSSLTAAAFYKDLKDVIVNQIQSYPLKDVNGQAHNFLVTSPVNGASAKVKGFELSHQQYYNGLPAWLSGLGTQVSYTHVDSRRRLVNATSSAYCTNGVPGDLTIQLNGCDTNGRSFGAQPLQGVARHTFNLALLYDHGPFSARMAYNWRSRVYLGQNFAGLPRGNDGLDTNPDSPTFGAKNLNWALPGYSNPYGQVDASVFYKLTPQLTFGLEGTNLTNAVFRQSSAQQFGMPGAAWFVTGPRYTATARYAL